MDSEASNPTTPTPKFGKGDRNPPEFPNHGSRGTGVVLGGDFRTPRQFWMKRSRGILSSPQALEKFRREHERIVTRVVKRCIGMWEERSRYVVHHPWPVTLR